MDDFEEVIRLMVPIGVEIMCRAMAVTILRGLLGRDPTPLETVDYENQTWLRSLTWWQQDRLTASEKIYQLVWGQ